MNRKNFLNSLITIGAGVSVFDTKANDEDEFQAIIPKYLKQGDIIGITSPAGYITMEEIRPAIQQMESWGFSIKVGDSIGKRNFTFGGTDEERARDFQDMLDNPSIGAIMCARGGYGFVRIIDRLNFKKLAVYPKWIIGFSDLTVLHNHLNRNYGIASIHSKMCNSFPDDWSKAETVQIETIHSIKKALTGEKMRYVAPYNTKNRQGNAEATLIGGNLKTIESLSGSKSDLKTAGKILFVEDTGEYLYSIDRMFWNLKRTGKLSALKGLIIGGFKIKPDDPGEEFALSLQDIVLEKIKEHDYPVCFDFPVGHQKNNFALKCGIKHQLIIDNVQTILKEF
ncbi:MAG: LD-carboxypeptidase [Chitinophagaceae bacterium]|nr:LD-carboxypeptidase [Chitinophagaceae bacterium]